MADILTLDDTRLSVWGLVGRVQQKSLTLHQRRTMNVISHSIEDTTLVDRVPTRIYAGFQRMSKFIPQIKRYTGIAQNAEQVYVFAVPDVEAPDLPNVTYVYLQEDSALAREWFLISRGDDYASALVTQEKTRFNDPDHLRRFQGIWTFDVDIINVLDQWMLNTVSDRDFADDTETQVNIASQQIWVQKTLSRLDAFAKRSKDRSVEQELSALKQVISASLSQR